MEFAPVFRCLWLLIALQALWMLAPQCAAAASEPSEQGNCAPIPRVSGRVVQANPATLHDAVAQARGGDLILLKSGEYGAVTISGVNNAFVELAADAGARPVLASLVVRGGSHWIVKGLTVIGHSSGARPVAHTPPARWPNHGWLMQVIDGDNIILTSNTVRSVAGEFPWRTENIGQDDPLALYSGIDVRNSTCIIVQKNSIENVWIGISLEGDQVGRNGKFYTIINNSITNFAGDGIDHAISNSSISRNVISNAHGICDDTCVHMDGIQGWNYGGRPGIVNHDITIDGNSIINQTDNKLILPSEAIQGITIFDGFWKSVAVTNNVVLVNAWHGITIRGADGLLVANNTVVAISPRQTWIAAGGATHQGGASNHVIVRNNLATDIKPPKEIVSSMTIDHNLIVDKPHALFTDFRPDQHSYDLHLKPHTAASGRGSPNLAPAYDHDGLPRSHSIDLGAYQTAQ